MEENENKSQPNPHRLEPLADNSSGSFELLKIEIERLKDENMRLEKQTVEYESKVSFIYLYLHTKILFINNVYSQFFPPK